MKKLISITAALLCSFFLNNPVIAQEAPKNPVNKDSKLIKEESVCKAPIMPNFKKFSKDFKPMVRMPRKITNSIEFFKFADELQLTDEQIIKLRAYYKKHYSEKTSPKAFKPVPTVVDFYKMTDEELTNYADELSMKTKNAIMSKLQKIIDIRKILTKEQLELIKKETEKEAENIKKKIEEKHAKNKNKKCGFFSSFMNLKPNQFPPRFCFPPNPMPQPFMPPMCCPQMGMMQPMYPPFGMMPHHRAPSMGPKPGKKHHNMPPMGPQFGMMPQSPMRPMHHQPFMMPQNHMPPMTPQFGMMSQPPMRPMPQQPFMMQQHHMPPMTPQFGMMPFPMQPVCPQMGMMPHNNNMPPMGPQPKFRPMSKDDKHGKDKKPGHKFGPKGQFPMMNPMGFYPGYMAQPNMMGCCPCQMRPPMFGFNDYKKERKPPFDFLMKLFSCKKDKDSDIILKDKENKSAIADKNQSKEPLKPTEKK